MQLHLHLVFFSKAFREWGQWGQRMSPILEYIYSKVGLQYLQEERGKGGGQSAYVLSPLSQKNPPLKFDKGYTAWEHSFVWKLIQGVPRNMTVGE